jgi:catechol 2,3-dioxygenase-like lactoylglutathione lyase family enzyme
MLNLRHHHGAMSVPDLEASIAWYARVLDFQVKKRFEILAANAKVAMLKRDELRIELFEVAGAAKLPADRRRANTDIKTHGNKHMAFAIESVDAAVKVLKERGADIEFVGRFEFGSNIFIRDNAGNLIEFVEEPSLFR